MKKKILFMLLLLSFFFIFCFNIKKINVEKENQHINDKVDTNEVSNEVVKSENKEQIEEPKELEEDINDITITEEEIKENKEEVKESNINNNSGSNHTSNNSGNQNNTPDKSNDSSSKQNNNNKEVNNTVDNDKSNVDITNGKSDQVTEEVEEDKNNPQEEQPEETSDNSVDIYHLDYPTHKGRIDCTDYNVCMEESLDFYFKYKKSVLNVYYVEVKSNSGKTLGYFTEYVFKDVTYYDYDECQRKGNEIKNILSDRVTNYMCSSSGTLTIITDY